MEEEGVSIYFLVMKGSQFINNNKNQLIFDGQRHLQHSMMQFSLNSLTSSIIWFRQIMYHISYLPPNLAPLFIFPVYNNGHSTWTDSFLSYPQHLFCHQVLLKVPMKFHSSLSPPIHLHCYYLV